jgi:hypothetical protein
LTVITLLLLYKHMGEGDKNARRFSKKIVVSCTLAFVTAISAAGYFGWQYFSLEKDPNKAQQETAARITDDVGEIYDLPASEKPTVAQVQDKNKLADQVFFKKAQNGDYLIVYQNEKLALLYRESSKKLINVGPISTDSQQVQATTGATTQSSYTTVKNK